MNNLHLRNGKVEFRWKRWRNKKRQEVSSCLMVLFSGMVLLGAGGVALAGPTGGQVTGGTGTITQNGGTTNIDQTSNVLNINWTDFSIGQTETVNFNQPDSNSLAINRVIGGVPSQLAGALNANGRVFILNSAGITFTGTSHVNVGALLATTAMTVNGDPTKAASYSGGTGYGAVINQGSIQVSNGGFAILAAPYVQNTGFIKADLGTIALAGTNQFTLDLSGTGLINFVVPAGTVEQIVSDGKALGVDNSGTLQARSGQLIISANVATQVINAAVNLNGVIDADAFAPNGAGGSVLVTGAGDINIGGQVTARGDGAGAGGQIITKAGGADAIEALAFVSAAGGTAGGKGGLIEVSGKTVALSGNIDPGSGGSLLIDPANINVTTAAGFNHFGGSTISEAFLERQLSRRVNVDLIASHNIDFTATGDSHELTGGRGNLILQAGDNIAFLANDYVIRTGSGNVTMQAGGSIGSPGHRLSIVSGIGGDMPRVSRAGDIVMSAGKDIFLGSVAIMAGGGSHFSADFSASAGRDFSAAGPIDVEAHAAGQRAQTADAEIQIMAGNDITLHGLTDIASASEVRGRASAVAQAGVLLDAPSLKDSGDLTVQAHVVAGAKARNRAAQFLADAQLFFDAQDIVVTGDISIIAAATNSGGGEAQALASAHAAGAASVTLGQVTILGDAHNLGSGSMGANASALFALPGSVGFRKLGGLDVEADASSAAGHGAFANAVADVGPHGPIEVGGDVVVRAGALNGAGSGNAIALADLMLDAGTGYILLNGVVDVEANATDFAIGLAKAVADATFAGSSGARARGAGPLRVVADAENPVGNPGNLAASASAQLSFLRMRGMPFSADASVVAHATNSGAGRVRTHGGLQLAGSFVQAGDITIDVAALNKGTEGSGGADASALFLPSQVVIDLTGINLHAEASSAGGDGAFANAVARVNKGSGFVDIPSNVVVKATAFNGPGRGNASALADVELRGNAVDLLGNLAVEASANEQGTGNAAAHATAILLASNLLTPLEGVQIGQSTAEGALGGNATVTAQAFDAGGRGIASARALASMSAPGSVEILGNLDVSADAEGPFALDSVSAKAIALLKGAGITIGGVDVDATAEVDRAAHGLALASFNALASAGNITLQNGLEVAAHENGSAAGSGIASAVARLQAIPSGSGAGGNLLVLGNIAVEADAVGGTGAGNVLALATLVTAIAGNESIAGDVVVKANALDSGSGFVFAETRAGLDANSVQIGGLFSGTSSGGDFIIDASAIGHGHVQNALALTANSSIPLNPSSGVGSLHIVSRGKLAIAGDLEIYANAFDPGGGEAAALAAGFFLASGSLRIDGAVDISADLAGNALVFGTSHGQAWNTDFGRRVVFGDAAANLTLVGGGVSLHDVALQAEANLTGIGTGTLVSGLPGTPVARATASLSIGAAPNIDIAGPVTLEADAVTLGRDVSVDARTRAEFRAPVGSITLANPLTLDASAQALGSGVTDAGAEASGSLFAARNITLPGARLIALADDPVGGLGGDGAANLRLQTLSGNVDVTHSGLFALGSIVTSGSPLRVVGVSAIRIAAGHDVSIAGDLTATGIALGGGSLDIAFGTIDVRAGLAGSGSILMSLTDMTAVALAEPGGHHASAGISLNAQDNILVVGNDPVAAALAGTTAAFLQTNSSAQVHQIGPTGTADAFIRILAGGTVVFVPPPD